MEYTDFVCSIAYLRKHPEVVFVFGDNKLRKGCKGAAVMRHEPNSYGFITKKFPSSDKDAYYHPAQYREVYEWELKCLKDTIENNTDKLFLISKLGAGLANRFGIFKKVIEPRIKDDLAMYANVKFLW